MTTVQQNSTLKLLCLIIIFQVTLTLRYPRSQISADGTVSDMDKMITKFIHPELDQNVNTTLDSEVKEISNEVEEIPVTRNRSLPFKQWINPVNETLNATISPRNGHSANLYQGEAIQARLMTQDNQFIILFGGINEVGVRFNDLQILALPSFNWIDEKEIKKNVGGTLPSERAGHSSAIFNDKLYVFGGEDTKGNKNDVFQFDLNEFMWSELKTYGARPNQRSFQSSTFIPKNGLSEGSNPKMVVFGGYTNEGFSNELFLLDLITHKWERPILLYNTLKDLPSPRQGAGLAYGQNKLWLFGGFQSGVFFNDLYTLDLKTYVWQSLTSIISSDSPSARQLHSMSFAMSVQKEKIKTSLYISGGCNYYEKKCYNDLYQLQLSSVAIISTNLHATNDNLNPREGHSLTTFGDTLISIGGCDSAKEQCYNDVEVIRLINDENEDMILEDQLFCSNNGNLTYDSKLGLAYCQCDDMHKGYDCTEEISCYNDCSGNGLCQNSSICSCFPGFSGEFCSLTTTGCGHNNCSQETNGGLCILQSDSIGNCKCNEDRYGQFCQHYKNPSWNSLPQSDQRQMSLKQTVSRVDTSQQLDDFLNEGIPEIYGNGTNTTKIPQLRAQLQALATAQSTSSSTTSTSDSNIFTTDGDALQDCKNECYGQGFCRDYVCYCFTNYTGEYCDETVDEAENEGVPISQAKFFLLGSGIAGLIIGLILINHYYRRNKDQEYHKFD